jgi:hypothetical protein
VPLTACHPAAGANRTGAKPDGADGLKLTSDLSAARATGTEVTTIRPIRIRGRTPEDTAGTTSQVLNRQYCYSEVVTSRFVSAKICS